MLVFFIVGKNSKPLFEADLQVKSSQDTQPQKTSEKKGDETHLPSFIVHASLDIIDEAVWKNSNLHLGPIDKHGNYVVSAFVTSGHTRFILLHKNQKSEEHIKQFFMDVNELYLKIEMNPFYQFNTPITSKVFRERVLQASQKRLGN